MATNGNFDQLARNPEDNVLAARAAIAFKQGDLALVSAVLREALGREDGTRGLFFTLVGFLASQLTEEQLLEVISVNLPKMNRQ